MNLTRTVALAATALLLPALSACGQGSDSAEAADPAREDTTLELTDDTGAKYSSELRFVAFDQTGRQ